MPIGIGSAMLGSAAIGAGSSLLGGFLGKKAGPSWKQQAELSREFAQKGIQWRVEDAKRAGIHPLYALGAASPSAPQFIPGQSPWGDAVKDAGAAISRAMDPVARVQLENAQAQTDLLKAQTRATDAQTKAAMGVESGPVPSQPASAQTYLAVGPYDPRKGKDLKPALVGVVQPDGSVDVIGNQEAGIENPEFLAAWYMFKDWAKRQGVKLTRTMAQDLIRLYDSSRGLSRERIMDDMIRELGRLPGGGAYGR